MMNDIECDYFMRGLNNEPMCSGTKSDLCKGCPCYPGTPQNKDVAHQNHYESLASEIGRFIEDKNKEYGNAYPKITKILAILFPDGIPVHIYPYLPMIERDIEKVCRLSATKPGDDVSDTLVDLVGIWLNAVVVNKESGRITV